MQLAAPAVRDGHVASETRESALAPGAPPSCRGGLRARDLRINGEPAPTLAALDGGAVPRARYGAPATPLRGVVSVRWSCEHARVLASALLDTDGTESEAAKLGYAPLLQDLADARCDGLSSVDPT